MTFMKHFKRGQKLQMFGNLCYTASNDGTIMIAEDMEGKGVGGGLT